MGQRKIELLQAEVDEESESYFRLLVDGHIKYLTINAGIYPIEDLCFGASLVPLLPDFPPGDWNDGLISKNLEDGNKPYFARVARTDFPGVTHQWHANRVDYHDLVVGRYLRTGIYEVTSPCFEGVVVAKFARFAWEIQYIENETQAYEWIDGYEIGPRFLGHLTEDAGRRVIGFLMERVTDAHHAEPKDLEACQQTLGRLHQLGISHGDVNRFNFLVRGSKAILIDFDTARKCDDRDVLYREYSGLSDRLRDVSMMGGGGLLPQS